MNEVNSIGITIFSSLVLTLSMMAIIVKSVFDSKNIQQDTDSQLPFTVPFIWLTVGLFGMLPDVAWLPTAMIIIVTVFAWITGRLESFPLLIISMFAALAIGFNSNVSGGGISSDGELWDVISNSAFYGAIFALIIHQMARTGTLYRFISNLSMPEKSDDEINQNYLILHNNDLSKELFLEFTKGITIAGLLSSFTAVGGIGPIIGAAYLTYVTISDKYNNLFAFLPVVHVLSLVNLTIQSDDIDTSLFYRIGGVLLIIEGLFLSYYTTKPEFGWKMFEWDDEDVFYTWLDNIGIVSMAYVVSGLLLAREEIGEANHVIIWGLMAIYLASIGLIGFREETEAPWRRGFGTFGAIISLFYLSMEFDADDSIFRYITWMFIGIVAFGFGILYMNRLGEISTLYETQPNAEAPPAAVEDSVEEALKEISEEMEVIDIDDSE